MRFGIYIHIPYCEHRCSYCDFTTFAAHQLMPIDEYVQFLIKEIYQRAVQLPRYSIDSLYFGGGTPSLLSPENILSIKTALANVGVEISNETEWTMEMNPSSAETKKIEAFIDLGVNRFSVGAQSFHQQHLKTCERIHSREETLQTLDFLKSKKVNFSLDLLYGLPRQTLSEVLSDIELALMFQPKHISAYLLTIPQHHKLNAHRPSDDRQLEMMDAVINHLHNHGYPQYEISNFSRPGFQSQHNLLYWTNQSYWGLGLSAHSYFSPTSTVITEAPQGLRFWNSAHFKDYLSSLTGPKWSTPYDQLPMEQKEFLKENEALTDFCHMHLRQNNGLNVTALQQHFPSWKSTFDKQMAGLAQSKHIQLNADGESWQLTPKGRHLLNYVLRELTF